MKQKIPTRQKLLTSRSNAGIHRLASRTTKTIALVIPRFEGVFYSYFALQVIKGIGVAAERLGYDLLIHITKERSVGIPPAIAGVLFLDIFEHEQLVERSVDEGIPTVVLNHYVEDLPVSCVAIDNRTAAERVVEYLAGLGHRDIATITGDLKTQAGLDRLDGFVRALRGRQFPVKDAYIRHADFGVAAARESAQALLSLPDRPSAIFAASDDMALETMAVALHRGLRVPEDLSIVGFDDNPIAAHGRVPLTTMRQPLTDMGCRGFDMLLDQVKKRRQTPTKLLLPAELIERESCRQTWLDR